MMINVRAAAYAVLLVLSTDIGAASAGALEEAAERYRPYMIEGAGHWVQHDRPTEVIDVLTGFLD